MPEYDAGDFFQRVSKKTPPDRCRSCWEMRLQKTASFAKENSFDAFTTTLLGSPYQDEGVLKGICEGLAEKEKVNFYFKDFRAGFRDAHKKAREKGMYCQNYCGCIYSMVEREEQRAQKKRLADSV